MKICLVNPTPILRRPIGELAYLLAEHGHEVTLAWSQVKKGGWGEGHFDRLAEHPQLKVLPIWSHEIRSLMWPIPTDRERGAKIRQILNENDVVHLWAPFYLFPYQVLSETARRTHRAKVVVAFDTIPAYSFHFGKSGFQGLLDPLMRLYWSRLASLLRKTDGVTLYSKTMVPYFNQAVPGFDAPKINILPTGTLFTQGFQKASLRKENEKRVPNILFIGILNRRKGIDTLIAVARRLREGGVKAHFTVVGSSAHKTFWERKAADLILKGTVTFIGRTPNVEPLYQEADIFFLPSRAEGLPGVIMEAMSYGLPIVSSKIPCITDLVTEGVEGYLHNPEDVEGFDESLKNLATHKEKRHSMGVASSHKIQSFSWEERYPLYEAYYKSLK